MPLPDPKHGTLSLATFRRDGTEVRTPVWFIVADGRIWVHTLATTWKVRRLRHNPRVRFAPCNSSGKRIMGDWTEGEAAFVDDPERSAWLVAQEKAKYSWQYLLIVQIIYPLLGRWGEGVVIAITPDA